MLGKIFFIIFSTFLNIKGKAWIYVIKNPFIYIYKWPINKIQVTNI